MHVHMLDLVLSCDLPIFNVQICDAVFSHHMPVLFDFTHCHFTKPCAPACQCRMVKPSTDAHFSSAFINIAQSGTESSTCLIT